MRFCHPDLPGRSVRLAYCLNLHPADTLEGLLAGLRTITLPLRERLAPGRTFGVGMYAPAKLAEELAQGDRWRPLKAFLDEHDLDPFTWNAFPYGGFGAEGLKARVFEPTWADDARIAYTLNVRELAARLARSGGPADHLSISTHTGWHGSGWTNDEFATGAWAKMTTASVLLAGLDRLHGGRTVLAMEPEPRANVNDMAELARIRQNEPLLATAMGTLGTCLDTCHAAVEFEDARASFEHATERVPFGKLQFTSALALRPERRSDVDALLALDEPRYLHQVTARAADGELLRVGDLPELRAVLGGSEGERWWRGAELRCHFHVPVDLRQLAGGPLATTRAHADATLAAALARPERWGSDDLHVEIETYTWDVLPRAARGPGELVDGLEREYRHVLARLAAGGWRPA